MKTTTLTITGYANRLVPHEFIRQDGETGHLAILLPGFAYSGNMPIFYYAGTLFLTAGADLLRLEYAYNLDPDFRTLAPENRLARLLADALPAVYAARAQRTYTSVSVVAKSLGTVTLAHLLARRELPNTTTATWLTPILSDDMVLETIRSYRGPQLVVIGESDPEYSADLIGTLASEPGPRTLTIPEADHSLDIPGDTMASIEALSATISAISSLISMR